MESHRAAFPLPKGIMLKYMEIPGSYLSWPGKRPMAFRKRHLLVSKKKSAVKHYGPKTRNFRGIQADGFMAGFFLFLLFALRSSLFASYPPAIIGIR
jgi:hypothetical protein